MKKILFTGGGSAGHVVPNIALIEELLKENDIQTAYCGTDGIEKSLIEPIGIEYFELACPKLVRGKSIEILTKNLKIPFRLTKSVRDAKRILKGFKPDVVFSKGGYVALPVVLAANKLKIPCFTHESDLSPGLANKIIAKRCINIFTSFPETADRFKNGLFTGAPIRKGVFERDRIAAKVKFALPLQKKVVLILGGGSGSKTINDAVRNNLDQLKNYSILHVCGKGNLQKLPVENYRQFEYLADIGEAYACADVVVSRAGAGAIFEILALRKPSVLVPLEGATRGDQVENAEYFKNRGLCKVLRQTKLDELFEKIEETLQDVDLKINLERTEFKSGNEKILSVLKNAL